MLGAVGRTWASAERTSSMRALEFGMPKIWLPDIEPDASNTIMASSVQGAGFLSSAPKANRLHASVAARSDDANAEMTISGKSAAD